MPKTHIFRVKPSQELLTEIKAYCSSHKISSGIITHIIGSFSSVKLGFLKTLPGHYITRDFKGPLEIVCCQGSVATMTDTGELVLHIHGMVSDENKAMGGHINEAVVFSTAEVVIEETEKPIKRYLDSYTGLREIREQ